MCDSALSRRGSKAAGYQGKAQESKRIHTDCILPSLTVAGAMHE